MLKFGVRNLGRIREAGIEVRPLTMFVGRNGTNKSWTAYAIWQALHTYSLFDVPSLNGTFSGDAAELLEQAVAAYEGLNLGGRLKLDLEVHPDRVLQQELRASHLAPVLGLPVSAIQDCELTLGLDAVAGGHLVDRISVSAERRATKGVIEVTYHLRDGRSETVLSFIDPTDLRSTLHTVAGQTSARYRQTVAFPVERVASVSLDGAPPARSLATAIEKARSTPGIRGRFDWEPLLGGRILNDEQLQFEPGGAAPIPLGAAASMVRSLAPLVLYLETVGEPGDLLVIDEPEMNAHPAAQLAIAELLAIMVNRGYHVIFTTHSPYIADHLCNLMEAHALGPEAREAKARELAMQTTEACLDPEQLAAYEFREVGAEVAVVDVLDREARVVDTQTFARVTDHVSEILGSLLSAK
ncbi:MAG: ATP-binding protein [Alphaproteobacteria bacterium]|nr:ATP-binding protein [Alphaproteobacteria bacterium]